jgi:hypothetical protein
MLWWHRSANVIDVPIRKSWTKLWFLRAVRFAILAVIVGGFWQAWEDLQSYREDVQRTVQSEIGYQCAARLDDSMLTSRINDYGNIEVGTIGCASGPFFVSMAEVRDVRAGKMSFETSLSPYYPERIFLSGLAMGFTVLLFSSIAIWVIRTIQWAWG